MQTVQTPSSSHLSCSKQITTRRSTCAASLRSCSLLPQSSLRQLRRSSCLSQPSRARLRSLTVTAGRITASEPWWEKNNPPNMKSITSVQELVDAMADAGDNLVIVDFYAQWCAACRALFPKLCQLCTDNPDITILKVDWDQNKQIAKPLGVKVLPFFMFYRGADGQLAAFSASVSKVQRLRDAIAEHNTARCYMAKGARLEQFPDVQPHPSDDDLKSHPPEVTVLKDVEEQQPAAV